MLADALSLGRIVLTQNRDDFKNLHRKGLPYQGIVTCTYDRDAEAGSEDRGGRFPAASGARWLVSVIRPNLGRAHPTNAPDQPDDAAS